MAPGRKGKGTGSVAPPQPVACLHPGEKQPAETPAEMAFPLAPVKAIAAERALARGRDGGDLGLGQVKVEAEGAARCGEGQPARGMGKKPAGRKALVKSDTKGPGKMVVAQPRFPESGVARAKRAAAAWAGSRGLTGKNHHRFEQMCDLGTGQSKVFVPTPAFGQQEARVDKCADLFRGAGLGKAGGGAKFGHGAGATIHHEAHHAGPDGIGERCGKRGDVGAFGHRGIIAQSRASVQPERFGQRRTIHPAGSGMADLRQQEPRATCPD